MTTEDAKLLANAMKDIADSVKSSNECLTLVKDEVRAIKESLVGNQLTTILGRLETVEEKIDQENNSLRDIQQEVPRQGKINVGFIALVAGLSIALVFGSSEMVTNLSTASLSDLVEFAVFILAAGSLTVIGLCLLFRNLRRPNRG